ncbi:MULTISPECIES: flagellar export chaperone FlgN [Pseudoalteromonas]|uniref:Flagellar export chaperone FlgN n=1 Tax=Pseudoalteromonas obscura TaxID=3048491 RepID=A0ABT7EI14_9GAMM|nr:MULTISPECIES: flagellar export chaperone FlgN [Pseudoalteromonas]MBQ4836332.1 flagellar export chaperone FlgN [Pseudoalteromonas luteoviolacea]MDK2594682.1 flagellar export chaperone FlgN [Pseudoalteromonas sp. P94(2023)]
MDKDIELCIQQLTAQITSLEALTQLLDDELTALSSRNGDGLKDIARQKITFLNTIQKTDKSLSTYPKELFQDPDVAPLTEQINLLLIKCKNQNEVNAKAAHLAHMTVRELKEILIGRPMSTTYTEEGNVVENVGEIVKNLKA